MLKGVDVSHNSVVGPTLRTDPHVIKSMGRWVIYGIAAGEGLINPYEAMLHKSLTASIFSVYAVFEREEWRQATDFMENWLQTEELISVSKTFLLKTLAQPIVGSTNSNHIGKIALLM